MLHRPPSVREAAYVHLRQAILEARLLPGERIAEPALAEQLGVSRTPVREALQRLSQEGLIELTPAKGARVRVVGVKEVQEVYQVRAIIEAEAARLCALKRSVEVIESLKQTLLSLDALPTQAAHEAVRLDMAFHAQMVAACGNRVLEQVFLDLRARLALIRAYSRDLSQSPEHWQVLLALQQSPDAAAQAAKDHVLHFMEIVVERIKEGQPWT